MSIILTIILGYLGLVLFVMLLTWWAYKRSQKNIPIGLRTYPHTTPPAEMDTEIECQLMSVDVIIVDADGQLRLCGYRRGKKVPEFSIFDLTDKKKFEEWKNFQILGQRNF
ncbi:hypothetical protein LCGC14_2015400 [marine sediment metagenome]|uniref:Uncharacterized protein n=1 Tax=marine sediment metagenome TaxID=412755 RepID=A0A0F9HW95_9ZZZZ